MSTAGESRLARLSVLFDTLLARRQHAAGINTFQIYVNEILAHAGFTFDRRTSIKHVSLDTADILIVALAEDDQTTSESLWQFAEQGGVVIILAGSGSLAQRAGCAISTALTAGYATLPASPAEGTPLRFLSAMPWNITESTSLSVEGIGKLEAGRPGGELMGPLIVRTSVGTGVIERWAVDVASTVVALQQGVEPVRRDGQPAPDGSAQINEGILKADDGFTLDWTLDRRTTSTGQPYFAYPYADLWREVLINRLLLLARERGLALPFVDYWPPGVQSVALISHDSDLNNNDSALTTLRLEQEHAIHSTWCILEPGYAPEVYQQIKAQGHELAFHYNSVEHEQYRWDASEFTRQFEWLKAAAQLETVASNKNHYTRFEGWGDLFVWLETAGIELDQTRGPSKRGNVGLLFGTCHPFFPIAWHDEDNRLYDVLELGFLTQDMDLGNWADSSAIAPFIDAVQRVRGVAHFLFHPIHLHQQEAVRKAFAAVISELRQRGFPFWTSRQINDWERARRTLRVEGIDGQGRCQVRRTSGHGPLGQVVVWAPGATEADEAGNALVGERFGLPCRGQIVEVM